MVLKSGAKCSVSHMTSTLRCASRSSRLNPIQITVDVQLAKQARMVARPSRDGRLCTREPQSRQIQFIDKQVRTGLSSPMKSSRDSGISTICSRLFPSMYLFIACSKLCLTHRQRTGKMVHCVFTQPRSGLDSHLFEFIAGKPPLKFHFPEAISKWRVDRGYTYVHRRTGQSAGQHTNEAGSTSAVSVDSEPIQMRYYRVDIQAENRQKRTEIVDTRGKCRNPCVSRSLR